MSKPLFDNVGRELKTIAETIAGWIIAGFAIAGLLILIAAIAIAVDMDVGWPAFIGIVVAVVVVVTGYNKARLKVIELYAYGELVERVTVIESKIGNKSGKKPTVKVRQEKREISDDGAPIAQIKKDGSWVCAYCDHENPPGADCCEECGFQAEFN